jgi:hypothetical protein
MLHAIFHECNYQSIMYVKSILITFQKSRKIMVDTLNVFKVKIFLTF